MKKNGYTFIDMLIVLIIVVASALIVIPRVSHALKESDNKDIVYQEILQSYLKQAQKYGEANKETIKDKGYYTITLGELIKAGYIGAYVDDGKLIDIRDNETVMNNIKIRLKYNEKTDIITAELA